MTASKKLTQWVAEKSKTDQFWVDEAKLDFAMALEKQLRAHSLAYSTLARKLGTSPAYVTKVFRGDSNLTIESMVKLARAAGSNLNIELVDEAVTWNRWQDLPKQIMGARGPTTVVSKGSATVIAFPGQRFSNGELQVKEAA